MIELGTEAFRSFLRDALSDESKSQHQAREPNGLSMDARRQLIEQVPLLIAECGGSWRRRRTNAASVPLGGPSVRIIQKMYGKAYTCNTSVSPGKKHVGVVSRRSGAHTRYRDNGGGSPSRKVNG
jgi:hypothetical protein